MKDILVYSIKEERSYGGEVISYSIGNNYKSIARVSKKEGDEIITAIKKNGTFYDYEVNVTNGDCLCWIFYFEIGELPEPEEKKVVVYGHCRYCGGKTFVDVPRDPYSMIDYEGLSDMMCKSCGRIIVESDLVYGRE